MQAFVRTSRQLWIEYRVLRSYLMSLLVAGVMLCAPLAVRASQSEGRVVGTKLLAPNVGWAEVQFGIRYRLLWTSTDGAKWADISPQMTPAREMRPHTPAVFFLDVQHGWMLVHDGQDHTGQQKFLLASTENGGSSWSVNELNFPYLDPKSVPLTGDAYISFADSLHGWINLDRFGSPGYQIGELVETSDGGRTWRLAPHRPGPAGPILFVTPQEGWLLKEGDQTELYRTPDGCKTWERVSPPVPKEAEPGIFPVYDLPIFRDPKHGFISVTYNSSGLTTPAVLKKWGHLPSRSTAVLFGTADGGATWTTNKILENLPASTQGQKISATVADSAWIIAKGQRGRAATTAISGARAVANEDTGYFIGGRILSFATSSRGWMINGRGDLLATNDGGVEWRLVYPAEPRTNEQGRVPNISAGASVSRRETEAIVSKPPGTTGYRAIYGSTTAQVPLFSGVSQHVGFDTAAAMSTNDMQTWWTNSPYFDAGFYVNLGSRGGSSAVIDTTLTPNWFTMVSNQGWGLMPLWSDMQPPCACAYGDGTYPNCNEGTFANTFSSNASVAQNQGSQEADSALLALSAQGVTANVVYLDLENYNSGYNFGTSSNPILCKDAVDAFISGWVSELHQAPGMTAGVYGSANNVANDFPLASPTPDVVWMASYSPSHDTVTVWNISNPPAYSLSDQLWPNHQRIRQYYENRTETWGSVQHLIDPDIDDSIILPGSGAKDYAYTSTFFGCPTCTYPVKYMYTNAISNGGPGGQMGQIVGAYLDLTVNGYIHALYGYYPNFHDLDCGDSTETWLTSVNNLGMSVGYYYQNGQAHGLVFNTTISGGTTCTAFDYPGAAETTLSGINDAGWIVGFYQNSPTDTAHYFVSKSRQFSSLSDNFFLTGVDGVGRYFGVFNNSSTQDSFIDDAGSGDWSQGTFTTFSSGADYTDAYGINNNGQVAGENGGRVNTIPELNWMYYNGNFTSMDTWIENSMGAIGSLGGINDEAQIIAQLGSQGIVAVPQY